MKGDQVNSRTTTSTKKKTSQDKSLHASKMEELTKKGEDHLRSTLLSDPRIKDEGKRFAEHFFFVTRKSKMFSCW